MTEKPTYEELEQKIRELEQEKSERKKAEEALGKNQDELEWKAEDRTKELQKSREMFRSITNTAMDAIFCKNLSRQYTFVNPSMVRLFGCNESDLIGKLPEEIFDKKEADIIYEVDKRALSGENVSEIRSLSISGRPYVFHTIQVPMHDSDGNIMGICGIVRDITELKMAEERLVSLNRTLDQKVKKRTNELKILNEHLIYAEEKERSKIAADLHDTVVQTLGLSVSKIKNMKESDDANNAAILTDIQKLIEQSLNEVRQMIYMICPPVLKDFDIATAIAFLVEENNKKFHADMQFINTFDKSIGINETKKITLYRAANELILNILKHSGVKKGKIELSKNQDSVLLKIEDNGIGFDMATINENPFNGFGLFALSERCKSMGGHIKIKSRLGEYTKAVLSIPLN